MRQTQELLNIERVKEDVIIGNEANQNVMVNEDEVQVGKVEQPRKRKKSKRILKMELAK